jgi:hypothetical protein
LVDKAVSVGEAVTSFSEFVGSSVSSTGETVGMTCIVGANVGKKLGASVSSSIGDVVTAAAVELSRNVQ